MDTRRCSTALIVQAVARATAPPSIDQIRLPGLALGEGAGSLFSISLITTILPAAYSSRLVAKAAEIDTLRGARAARFLSRTHRRGLTRKHRRYARWLVDLSELDRFNVHRRAGRLRGPR
jgi:hypothetical protein